MVEFDEVTRTFTCDDRQPLKQPDWTYLEAPLARRRDAASSPRAETPGRPRDLAGTEEFQTENDHGE